MSTNAKLQITDEILVQDQISVTLQRILWKLFIWQASKLKYVEQAELAIEEVQYLISHTGWKEARNKEGYDVKSLFFPKYSRKVIKIEVTVQYQFSPS